MVHGAYHQHDIYVQCKYNKGQCCPLALPICTIKPNGHSAADERSCRNLSWSNPTSRFRRFLDSLGKVLKPKISRQFLTNQLSQVILTNIVALKREGRVLPRDFCTACEQGLLWNILFALVKCFFWGPWTVCFFLGVPASIGACFVSPPNMSTKTRNIQAFVTLVGHLRCPSLTVTCQCCK